MKRILVLALAAGMVTALASTGADARGGGGRGGGVEAWAEAASAAAWAAAAWAVVAWAAATGRRHGWHGRRELGRRWRPLARRRLPGWGWGAAGLGAAAAAYPWGYGYDAYASSDDSCLQQRQVRRNGTYRTVWVRVC